MPVLYTPSVSEDAAADDSQDHDFHDDSDEFVAPVRRRDALDASTTPTQRHAMVGRNVMLLLIVATGVGLSLGVYRMLTKQENDLYHVMVSGVVPYCCFEFGGEICDCLYACTVPSPCNQLFDRP